MEKARINRGNPPDREASRAAGKECLRNHNLSEKRKTKVERKIEKLQRAAPFSCILIRIHFFKIILVLFIYLFYTNMETFTNEFIHTKTYG